MNMQLVIALIITAVVTAGGIPNNATRLSSLLPGLPGLPNPFVKQKQLKFSSDFLFGAATSAVQVEGAWNVDGKGPSGWDDYIHMNPTIVTDNSTSDVACDSYHKYSEDMRLLKSIGMNAYRFSLSWPRLLPNGTTNYVNQKAVDYYNNMINEALSLNITPLVTIYHWDLPATLSKMGGWSNSAVIRYFVEYAEFVLTTFGDRVKLWVSVNEAHEECLSGYAASFLAPGINYAGVADYLCGHNKLLAHAQVYHLYKSMPDNIQAGGKMGMTFDFTTYYPHDSLNVNDYLAAEYATEFSFGWFANPIYGPVGDYPPVMRARIDALSAAEGLDESRLPRFTQEEIALIKGSADFLGLNQYSGALASFIDRCPGQEFYQVSADAGVISCPSSQWENTGSPYFQMTPGSMKLSLQYIRDKYNNPEIYVTENGYAGSPTEDIVYDAERQAFFQDAISGVLESIEDGCKVRGYMVWSLLDDMEWYFGYTIKFGIVHIDFNSPNRTRTMKGIGKYLNSVINNGLNVNVTQLPTV